MRFGTATMAIGVSRNGCVIWLVGKLLDRSCARRRLMIWPMPSCITRCQIAETVGVCKRGLSAMLDFEVYPFNPHAIAGFRPERHQTRRGEAGAQAIQMLERVVEGASPQDPLKTLEGALAPPCAVFRSQRSPIPTAPPV